MPTDERGKMSERIVTERVTPCSCGYATVECRGGQNPDTLEWWLYCRCPMCGNCERGAHDDVPSAVAAWNRCAIRVASSEQEGK